VTITAGLDFPCTRHDTSNTNIRPVARRVSFCPHAYRRSKHVTGRRGEHQEAHLELQENAHRIERTVDAERGDGGAHDPRDVRRSGGLQPVQVSERCCRGMVTGPSRIFCYFF